MKRLITEFNVTPNSEMVQTDLIQKAIDECAKENVVLEFVPGTYNTGTLFLRTNTSINLLEDAVISGSDNMEDYPDNEASFVDAVNQKRGKALIIAYRAEDIKITGEGKIFGNGTVLLESTRPFLVRIVESKNVKIQGVSLCDAAAWCLHINGSSNVLVDGITIDSRVNANNDGIDIDASNHITIKNSHIMSGDDGICLKATMDCPCEYINVENCKVLSGWAGFKIGTESVGDIRHISVKNCYFYDVVGGGIKIVPTDGANVEDVIIENIEMSNCTGPIFIALGERLREYAGVGRKTLSTIKDVKIVNVKADVVSAPIRGEYLGEIWGNAIGGIIISGTKLNFIKNLTLKNIEAALPGGVTDYVEHEVIYIADKYPEFHMMDTVPAKGLYLRNIENSEVSDFKLSFKAEDVRKLYHIEDCNDLKVENINEVH